MIYLLEQKLLQNANEFRYMYFGIILTILFYLFYKFLHEIIKECKKEENIKSKITKIVKNKYLIGIIVTILPIILEIFLYKNYKINFSKGTYIRLAYIYALYIIIAIYKFIINHEEKFKKILNFCVKHRYTIAVIVFALLVICKIHFSSIGMWNNYIREGIDSTLLGKSRAIRSDEWLVTTPFNLSQQYNGFKLINDNLNLGNNDMNIFHAPVLDLSIVVRVFSWGYILFGNEIGLSWAWVLKFIAMFIIYFELGMIITKKDKVLAVMLAVWLTFSPAIMWWSMLDTIAFAMAIVVLFNAYISNKNISIKKKLLIAFGMIVFLCQFAFALYPAWQVPLAYIILAFVIVDFIKYRKNLSKKDYLIMGITILITILILAYFFVTSWNGINAMMSTKYPGGRAETGGDYNFNRLTNYYTNFFTPYTDDYENPCDLAAYIFPGLSIAILLLTYIINIVKDKKIKTTLKDKNNWYILAILIVLTIFLLWLACKWPSALAKISFLYTSPTKRTALIFEFGCVIVTAILAKKIFDRKEKLINNKVALAISILITILTYFVAKNGLYANTFSTFKYVVLLIAIFAINYTFLSSNKKAFAYVIVIISLFVGGYVNPISRGTSVITDTEIAQTAVKIANEDKEGIWIGESQVNAQYLVANGLKVLNGINEYPNYDWIEKLDPEHKYEEVWNRYAHIAIILDKETSFDLLSTDIYFLHLTYDNLKQLNIKYLYTNVKADETKKDNFKLETLYENDLTGQYIYEIN